MKKNHNRRRKSHWTSAKDSINIKKEPITPPKTKQRRSKTSTNSKQKKIINNNTNAANDNDTII